MGFSNLLNMQSNPGNVKIQIPVLSFEAEFMICVSLVVVVVVSVCVSCGIHFEKPNSDLLLQSQKPVKFKGFMLCPAVPLQETF